MQFWTSASSEGQYCSLNRKFSWCTTGTIVDEKYINDTQIWSAAPNGSEAAGNCVTLGLNADKTSAQLSLAACADSKPFICLVCNISPIIEQVFEIINS
jgi:hypothetical protein